MARTRMRQSAALVILLIGAAGGARAADCECRHLEALQIELRNALRLQQAFNAAIPGLRPLSAPAAQARLQALAQSLGEGGFVRRPPGDRGPGAVDYIPYGDGVSDLSRRQTATDLCDPSAGSRDALKLAKDGAVCKGIGDAIQAHEDVHHALCRQIGYPRYRDLHAAERAMEEVQAYDAQIRALRAEIARVLERAQPRLEFEGRVRAQFPPPSPAHALVVEHRGLARAGRAAVESERFRVDVQGSVTEDAKIEGTCRITFGYPRTLALRGRIDTDGLEAQISFTGEGTLPGSGMECTVPGMGTGRGMSMPVPVMPGTVPAVTLPLRDGETVTLDMAKSEGAAMVRRSQVIVTGHAKITLVLCPTR